MTYSIVALDPATGDLGVATQSKFLAVGAVVPWARAGVGAIATQAFANVAYGPGGLEALVAGRSAAETLAALVEADALREHRQVGIVDAHGGSASHTGRECFAWAGGRTGPGFAAQGNILARADVVDGITETFLAGGQPFPELLVACLAAAEAAGGDRRGRESAALLIVREGGGYGGANDRWIDLRVDHHDDPVAELGRLLEFHHLYLDRPEVSELLPIDEPLAAELRSLLVGIGAGPGSSFATAYQPMWQITGGPPPDRDESLSERPVTGNPRPLPDGWNDAWQEALWAWMAVENLEERTAAAGWIDPRVLAVIRARGA